MKKIVLASNNKHKVKEIKEILSDYDILTLNDISFYGDIVEDGKTFLQSKHITYLNLSLTIPFSVTIKNFFEECREQLWKHSLSQSAQCFRKFVK